MQGKIVKGIAGIFKFPINLIIDGINSFISGLNKIKIPDNTTKEDLENG